MRKLYRLMLGAVVAAGFASSLAPFALAQAEPGSVPEIAYPESAPEAKSVAASDGKLDLNSASLEQLETVPGIGDALARKIIAGRPYRTKLDLVHRKIIPRSLYLKIKDQIIAKQKKPATTAPAPK